MTKKPLPKHHKRIYYHRKIFAEVSFITLCFDLVIELYNYYLNKTIIPDKPTFEMVEMFGL